MKLPHLSVVFAAAATSMIVLAIARPSEVRAKSDSATGCPQWEIRIAEQATVESKLPEYGKAPVLKAPAGWEPFAFAPTGALVYRRCGG